MIVVESIINNVTYSVELGDVSTLSVSQAIAAKDTAEQVAQMVLSQRTEIDGIASTVTQDRQATQALRNETEGIKNAAVTETTAIKDEAVAQTASNLAQTIAKTQEAETARANAVAAASSATAVAFSSIPARPSAPAQFVFDFADSQMVDPRLTCVRSGNLATRVNRYGVIEVVPANRPRIDYDPVTGECRGLLIEWSNSNSGSPLAQFVSSVGLGSASPELSPMGMTNAFRFEKLNAGDFASHTESGINNPSSSPGTRRVMSIFIKKATNQVAITYEAFGSSNATYCTLTIDTSNGSIVSNLNNNNAIVEIEDYPRFGWWRVSICIIVVSTTTWQYRTTLTTKGNGIVDYFGHQSEGTPSPNHFKRTSYVHGASRGQDMYRLPQELSKLTGTFLVELGRKNSQNMGGRLISTAENSAYSFLFVRHHNNILTDFSGFSNSDSVNSNIAQVNGGVKNDKVIRAALAYGSNLRKLCTDGSAVSIQNSYTPTTNSLTIGSTMSINGPTPTWSGYITKLIWHSHVLPDAEMVAWTQYTTHGGLSNQSPVNSDMGTAAKFDINAIQRMPTRMTLPFFGNGTNQTYSFTLDFDCEIVTIHTTGSTFTRPTGVILAGTSITITHNAPVGTVMFLAFLPIIQ